MPIEALGPETGRIILLQALQAIVEEKRSPSATAVVNTNVALDRLKFFLEHGGRLCSQ